VPGGRVWPLEQLRSVVDKAREHDLKLHLDGARLLNAVVATGIAAHDWTRGFDTAWIDFTKCLGAPVGACLAGSAELIEEAWRYKQMLGGAMRQAGMIAAGALYGLDHHVERLAEDHANARRLAAALAKSRASRSTLSAFKRTSSCSRWPTRTASARARRARRDHERPERDARERAVTHLDARAADVDRAAEVARAVLAP